MKVEEARFLAPHLVGLAEAPDPLAYCRAYSNVWSTKQYEWAKEVAMTIEAERISDAKCRYKSWCVLHKLEEADFTNMRLYWLETEELKDLQNQLDQLLKAVAQLEKLTAHLREPANILGGVTFVFEQSEGAPDF